MNVLTTMNSFFSNENIIAAAVIVVILVIVGLGVVYTITHISETDKAVFGCWDGQEINTSNTAVDIAYLFWSRGTYSIVGRTFANPLFERGTYSTARAEDGSVALTLTPDTTTKRTTQFPQFGVVRTVAVAEQQTNAGRTLAFNGGTPFVESSCDLYNSLP